MPNTDPIFIVDYDPRWPEQFKILRASISGILSGITTFIEHVGSTSVPGLAAKPIIDIDVLLISANDLPRVIEKLAVGGYEHRGDLGIAGREAFRNPPTEIHHHLYVCPPRSPEYVKHIAFRDHLRTHGDDAAAYGELKRKLAVEHRDNREAYNHAKSDFVNKILRSIAVEAAGKQ